MQNQRSLNHFNISHIAFLAKNKQKRLSLDVISREFKDLYDSPPLQTRLYLIHPQHFAQTYPASQGPQKSSRIYLCSLLNKSAITAGLSIFRALDDTGARTGPNHGPIRAFLAIFARTGPKDGPVRALG